MFSRDVLKSRLGVEAAVSAEMAGALETWGLMYKNQAGWLNKFVHSMNLPAAIASELANLATLELRVQVAGGTPRAAFLQAQVAQVLPKLRQMIEYGNAKGGLVLKPWPGPAGLSVDFVQADQFLPLEFDASGSITACVFLERVTQGRDQFTRLEWHRFDAAAAQVSVHNLAFRSASQADLGTQVKLEEVPAWAGLAPQAVIAGVRAPLYGYYRFPLANNIDPASPLGMSCYSRAVDLIRQADELWSNLLWEFESGKRAIFADVLAFDRDDEGRPILPDRRLYRALANSGATLGEDGFFHEFTPAFREASILNGLDAVLKKIEYNCGLAYGTLSDPQTQSKTATEIKISRQRTYATVRGMQQALASALDALLYAMDVWATLYALAPEGAYSAIYDFDDSVVVDKDQQFQQDLRLVQQGVMSRVEFRMRNFGEDEASARARIAAVQGEDPAGQLFAGD